MEIAENTKIYVSSYGELVDKFSQYLPTKILAIRCSLNTVNEQYDSSDISMES